MHSTNDCGNQSPARPTFNISRDSKNSPFLTTMQVRVDYRYLAHKLPIKDLQTVHKNREQGTKDKLVSADKRRKIYFWGELMAKSVFQIYHYHIRTGADTEAREDAEA